VTEYLSAASRPRRPLPRRGRNRRAGGQHHLRPAKQPEGLRIGRKDALADPAILAKKQAEEADFRAKVAANPEWQKAYGDAWDTIAKVEEQVKPEIKGQLFRRTDSRLFGIALNIVQYVAEIKKPDGERCRSSTMPACDRSSSRCCRRRPSPIPTKSST
jgi:hypothetical protein